MLLFDENNLRATGKIIGNNFRVQRVNVAGNYVMLVIPSLICCASRPNPRRHASIKTAGMSFPTKSSESCDEFSSHPEDG